MARPREIIWFVWLQLASSAITIFTVIDWKSISTELGSGRTGSMAFLIELAFAIIVALLVIFFIWKGSNIARWIYVILSGTGLLFVLATLADPRVRAAIGAVDVLQLMLGFILIALLFMPGARRWFNRRRDEASAFQ